MIIPCGASIWQSDLNWSQTSPARCRITPAKVTPRRSGLPSEVTQSPPSSAKSQCGGPPTASIRKTGAQPEEEATSKRSPPSGNNASTEISPVPATRQQMRGPTSDRHDAPHLVQVTTGNAGTQAANGVRGGRPRPVDSTVVSTLPNLALSDQGPGPGQAARVLAPLRAAPGKCTGGTRAMDWSRALRGAFRWAPPSVSYRPRRRQG
jgi:hypothetical protein